MLIQQLARKGLNNPTLNAVATIRNDNIHKWVIDTRDLDPGAGPIAALTAFTDALVMEHVQRMGPPPEGHPHCTCWGCGKPGHLKQDCPLARPKI